MQGRLLGFCSAYYGSDRVAAGGKAQERFCPERVVRQDEGSTRLTETNHLQAASSKSMCIPISWSR